MAVDKNSPAWNPGAHAEARDRAGLVERPDLESAIRSVRAFVELKDKANQLTREMAPGLVTPEFVDNVIGLEVPGEEPMTLRLSDLREVLAHAERFEKLIGG